MKRSIFAVVVSLLVVPGLVRAAPPTDPVVQIADRKDEGGAWIWAELTVTWDTTPHAGAVHHNPLDDDINQDWFVPLDGEWWHFSFEREVKGEYAIRWKHSDASWSDPETCSIRPPDPARHTDG